MSVSDYGGNFWLGSSSSAAIVGFTAAPVELSASPFYAADGNGGNAAIQDVSVPDFSTAGTQQTTIGNVLQKIETALPSYSVCNNWLVGGDTGLSEIQQLLQSNAFGHGTVHIGSNISYETWAFSGRKNPDGTLVNLPIGIAMTVNNVAGFFNSNAPIGSPYNGAPFSLPPRNYQGNTLRAQAATLIHEVAHQISVPGFQPDFGDNKAEKANQKAVDTNCRQLIEALQ